jgi:tRNA(Ile)-lysidine synthetase-like protein
MKLDRFSFKIWQQLQNPIEGRAWSDVAGKKWLVACSGGVDSVVLAQVLKNISKEAGSQLVFCYVHHGDENLLDQIEKSRNQACRVVAELAAKLGVQFISIKSSSELKSEAEMREFRMRALAEAVRKMNCDSVWLGQHAQDQLETRLIQLIRGSGASGLKGMSKMKRMAKLNFWALRPFLDISKNDILRYAKSQNLTWHEDLSNQDTKYFRNWLRTRWLPELESYRPGALHSLSKSFDICSTLLGESGLTEASNISSSVSVSDTELIRRIEIERPAEGSADENHGARSGRSRAQPLGPDRWDCIDRSAFDLLSPEKKATALRRYLEKNGWPQGSRNQTYEIIKRLDSKQKRLRFSVNGMVWETSVQEIWALAPGMLERYRPEE